MFKKTTTKNQLNYSIRVSERTFSVDIAHAFLMGMTRGISLNRLANRPTFFRNLRKFWKTWMRGLTNSPENIQVAHWYNIQKLLQLRETESEECEHIFSWLKIFVKAFIVLLSILCYSHLVHTIFLSLISVGLAAAAAAASWNVQRMHMCVCITAYFIFIFLFFLYLSLSFYLSLLEYTRL